MTVESRQNESVVEMLLSSGAINRQESSLSVIKDYIKFLLTSSVTAIHQQPQLLQKEQQDLSTRLKKVTCDEYKAFLKAHDHLEHLNSQAATIPPVLKTLESCIPEIIGKAQLVEQTFENGLSIRKANGMIANRLEYLEPILEIPLLFDTLIRNNHYEEAMDLQLHTQRLPIRYPGIPLLEELAKIRTSSQAMLNQLFGMLRGPAKLQLCVRVIGYLRRLGFPEYTLRVLFLNLRYEYLKNLLGLIRETTKHDYVRRWIETQREHLFDMITHYNAIFRETDSTMDAEKLVLSSFSMYAVKQLVHVVKEFLDQVEDVALLPSINTQIMYYGMSLGRLGLDFRPLFVSMIEDSVFRVVKMYFGFANQDFVIREGRIERPLVDAKPQDMLMKYGPVAMAYNHYFSGLNQLRYLPCRSIHHKLSKELVTSLEKIVDLVLQFNSRSARETEILAWIIHDCLVPSVCQGLDTVMGRNGYTQYQHMLDALEPFALRAKPSSGNLLTPAVSTTQMEINVEDDTNVPAPINSPEQLS
jgi:hypothetical protein